MHHMDADEAYREKARRELHKNATSYIEQNLEAISHKTAAVRPMDPFTWTCQCWPTNKNLSTTALYRLMSLKDQLEAMDCWDEWREKIRKIRACSTT